MDDVYVLPSKASGLSLLSKQSGLFMGGQSHSSLGIAHMLTGDVGGASHKAIYRLSQHVPENYYKLDDTYKIKELRSRGFDEYRNQKPNLMPIFFTDEVEPFEPIHRIEK